MSQTKGYWNNNTKFSISFRISNTQILVGVELKFRYLQVKDFCNSNSNSNSMCFV